jgi:hypothetical protein
LNLAGTKAWEEIDLARFERLAERARLSHSLVTKVLRETALRMRDIWPRVRGDLPADDATKALVSGNLVTLPLFTTC